ncbi:hypothetical protein Q8F55_004581 [Vanrija albida]|uniref:Transcription factor domain-containing protein n=1 Tax=Vanrija albida TaxID=181172 RepID=A0ABR3Q8A1_9TREE
MSPAGPSPPTSSASPSASMLAAPLKELAQRAAPYPLPPSRQWARESESRRSNDVSPNTFLADSLLSLGTTAPLVPQHQGRQQGPPTGGSDASYGAPLASDLASDLAPPPRNGGEDLSPSDPSNIRMADYIDRPDGFTDLMDAQDGSLFPRIKPATTLLGNSSSGSFHRGFDHEDPGELFGPGIQLTAVYLGILSLIEARNLVEQFHQTLNPLISMLEPKRELALILAKLTPVHTYEYMRQRSTILLSAVLAASAKFFKRDVYPALLTHANTVASRAILSADESKALVQALLIQVYWKDPTDTSAWRKIGWAIRMGYQFHWHLPRKRPLPEDRQLALEILVSCAI